VDKKVNLLDREQKDALKRQKETVIKEKAKELKDYIWAIKEFMIKYKVTGKNAQGEILKNILVHMGYTDIIYRMSSIEKWFQGRDKIDIEISDFKQNEINFKNFDLFLRGLIGSRWIELGEDFQKMSKRFDFMNEDFFYNELLVYFLEIIDIEIPPEVASKRRRILEEQEQLRKEQSRKSRLEMDKTIPSGILFDYSKDIGHIEKITKAIESGVYEKWEQVVDEVEKYCEESRYRFKPKSVDDGLEEILKTWRNNNHV